MLLPERPIQAALGQWVAIGLLSMVLVFTPAMFGGVAAWGWAAAATAVVVALGGLVAGSWVTRHLELERGPMLGCLGIVAAVALAQQIPLPPQIMSALAPRTDRLFSEALAGVEAQWLPLAFDRSGALEASLKGFAYLCAFLLARRLGRQVAHVRWLLLVLVAVGCFESFYGLGEQYVGEREILGWRKPPAGGGHRVSGTYVNPNHFGGLLAMCGSVALGLLLLEDQRDHRNLPPARTLKQRLIVAVTSPNAPRLLLQVLAVLVIASGLVASGARGAAAGLLCGAGLVGLFAWRSGRFKGATPLVVGVLSASLLGLASEGVARLADRFQGEKLLQEADLSLGSRLSLTKSTLTMAANHPLTGVGVGSFEPAFLHYAKVPGTRIDHAHNDYAQLLAELGIVGWTALGLALILVVRDVLSPQAAEDHERRILARVALAGVAPLVVHSLVDFNLRLPATALWAVVLLGLAWGVARPERTQVRPLPRALPARISLGACLLIVGAVPCWAAFQIARADWIAFPRVEREQGDERSLVVQLEDQERACQAWPWEGRHWARLAGLRYQVAMQAELEQAERAAERLTRAVTTPEAKQRLRDAVVTSRLRSSKTLQSARAQAAEEARRAVLLAPGNRLWNDLWRELSRP
nr:O-antigen ligase family protein [Nitrosomonas nitrosa]